MKTPAASRSLALGFALLAATLAPTAAAAWPHSTSSSGVVVRAPAGTSDRNATAVTDGAGGAIVVWEGGPIFAQRFDPFGNRLWSAAGVQVTSGAVPGSRFNVVAIADGAGGVILAWEDLRNGATKDLYAQRLNASGTPLWTANGVPVCIAGSDQQNIRMTLDSGGNVNLAWEDLRNSGTTGTDVFAQRLSSAGAPIWTTDGVQVCNAAGAQTHPVLAQIPPSGGLWIAWQDARTDAGDIYAQVLNSSGAPGLAVNGVAAHNVTTDSQNSPEIQPDGSLGCELVWVDNRAAPGAADLYAQHLNVAGAKLWGASGVAVCAATGACTAPTIASDGVGGLLTAWADSRSGLLDVYMRRVDATGVAKWTADGVAIGASFGNQMEPALASDGTGGAYVAWRDERTGGTPDVYVQRVTGNGAPLWTADGNAVCSAPWDQTDPSLFSGGSDGLYVAWTDTRVITTGTKVFAQRLDEWGYLGAEPAIHDVADVPNDQGGRVKVSWDASPLDTDPAFRNIADYQVFRSAPPNMVAAALRANAVFSNPADAEPGDGRLLAPRPGIDAYYWELLATIPASHLPNYSTLAATSGDSVGGGNPLTAFLVMARTAGALQWWSSAPDSGYSVDNLPPPPPSAFEGQYAAGSTSLHWHPSPAPDLAGYRLYRGSPATFPADPAHLVAAPSDTGYVDAAGSPFYYKLTAVDTHENESAPVALLPDGTVGVAPHSAPAPMSLSPPWPNPMRSQAGATITFNLARAQRITLLVFDQGGRIRRRLLGGEQDAGTHVLRFDGRDLAGHPLASGLYFLRLATPDGDAVRRITLLD